MRRSHGVKTTNILPQQTIRMLYLKCMFAAMTVVAGLSSPH